MSASGDPSRGVPCYSVCRYMDFLQECRQRKLTADSYAFICGAETTVPGSWLKDGPVCGNARCSALKDRWAAEKMELTCRDWEQRSRDECVKCRRERKRRNRLASGPADDRFALNLFHRAPCIVPNNDIKNDVAKQRSLCFASRSGAVARGISFAIADDRPTLSTLQEDPAISRRKKEWVQRHDRECGGLYGVVPNAPESSHMAKEL